MAIRAAAISVAMAHVQPTLGGLGGHEVVQPRDLAQRLLRQHLCDDSAERLQRIVRIAGRMQEDKAVGLAASLRHWKVHLGTRADLEARLPHVGHGTHDATLLAAADDDDRASEWVVPAKEHARRRVAEDDDGFRSFTIIVSKMPPAPEGDRQRPVVTGGNGLEAHDLVGIDRLAWRPQRIDTHIDAQGNARCRGSIDHAWQPPRAIDDVGIGLAQIGRREAADAEQQEELEFSVDVTAEEYVERGIILRRHAPLRG
jgi:hypothetical protein